MAALNSGKIIRQVRYRLDVSQESLSRLMNTSKGAVQHWERGRNSPGKARLLALRQLCPPSSERKELDALIRGSLEDGGPVHSAKTSASLKGRGPGSAHHVPTSLSRDALTRVRRETSRLQRQVAKLESALKSREERLRIVENLATNLQREMAQMRAAR